MRVKKKKDGLTVLGVAGAYVVSLGMNMSKADMKGVLGFAVQRTDHQDGEVSWMRGVKTFEATDPKLGPGAQASSHDHPFQTFQWADYSVYPERKYTYRVIAMRGKPEKLVDGETVELEVTTESEIQGKHAVFFNRGAIASQEYARRFLNKKPSEVGEPAYKWLSRGLVEALLDYIKQANGAQYELYGAIYQFQNTDVFAALKKAKDSGATVRVIYDDKDQANLNEAALAGSGIKSLCIPRTNSGNYAHNKFFVLKKGGKPISVLTGSTNQTENGIYGHSNNIHIVRDQAVAQAFLDYWNQLRTDPMRADLAPWNTANSPAPANPWDRETTAIFSPRKGLAALDWYATIAGEAEKALFMTFAFGINERFITSAYEKQDDVLRFALMENKGMNKAQQAEVDRVRKLPNVVVAVGKYIPVNKFDRWLKETSQIGPGTHVRYIHTKYMLVDPLGNEPIVVVGSANFSKASTDTNDENMLVIRGNKAIADIYFGEFMRLHTHYAFRESLSFKQKPGETWTPKYLIPSSDWINDRYFLAGSDRSLRREYFSGG